jgi:hypothetical protein
LNPDEKFDAVGADAGVSLAETARKAGTILVCRGFFSNDQEIVAARMGLGERNQSSSETRKVRCAAIAGEASGMPRGDSWRFLERC